MDFAIEPSFGFRTEFGAGDRDWDHVPLEINAAWLMLRGDVTPLLGGGLGLHYLHEQMPVGREVGSILVSTTTDVIEDSVFGFSAFARAGVLLLRTYDVSLLVALDYAITFARLRGARRRAGGAARGRAHHRGELSMRIGLAVIGLGSAASLAACMERRHRRAGAELRSREYRPRARRRMEPHRPRPTRRL